MRTNLSPKIRLAHVITTPAYLSSGVRTRLEAQVGKDIGLEVDLITGSGLHDQRLLAESINGIRQITLPSLNKYIHPHKDLVSLLYLYRLFRRERYDVVQTHLAKAGVIGRIAAKLAKVPLIIHDVAGFGFPPTHSKIKRLTYLALERLAGDFTTHYIFYAHHLKQTFIANNIGAQAIKKVIYPGMDLSSFLHTPPLTSAAKSSLRESWQIGPNDIVIGYVARMVPSKGHAYLIQAFHLLSKKYDNLKLLLIGGPLWPQEIQYMQELKNLTTTLGLSRKVIFAGHQSNIIPFYQILDIFALPSLYEGTANVMLESLTSGLPLVAFDIPAVREFAPEQTITCPPTDIIKFAECLDRSISNKNLPSKKVRDRLVDQFSPQNWRRNLISFYRELNLVQ